MLTLHPASSARLAGFTLIEFMIAITLSLLVLSALTAAFVANSRSRAEIEKANEQMESGRFALQILTDDLETAGFLSHLHQNLLREGLLGPQPVPFPNPCATSVAPSNTAKIVALKEAMLMHIQGFDSLVADKTDPAKHLEDDGLADGNDLSNCNFLADQKTETDIVVVRRTATCALGTANCGPAAPDPGTVYFQASLCSTELNPETPNAHFALDFGDGTLDRTQRNCAVTADLRQYLTHIYFIANNDQDGDGIPTLKRAELDNGADFRVVPLARGIEDLQIEYGVDGDGDGAPEGFTSSPAVAEWRDVMTVRLHVLARNTEPTRDYLNTKQYVLAQNAPVAFNDAYKRHVYQTTVRLNNPAGRREQ